MLAEVFPMGGWKSLIEMEEELTLQELKLLANAAYEIQHRHHRFLGMLKGIDIDELTEDESDPFEEVKIKANAAMSGKSEERYVLEDVIGIDFYDETEENVT